MTRARTTTPLWPFIGAVGCLLILTVLASQSWRQADTATSDVIPNQTPTPSETATWATPRNHAPTATVVVESPVARQHPDAKKLLSLDAFQTAQQVARIAPPVTERVEFDPSFDQLPSLPAPESAPALPRIGIAPRLTPPSESLETPKVPVARKPTEAAPHVATYWPLPKNLLSRLDDTAKITACQDWASRTRFTIEQLHQTESPNASSVVEHLNALDAAVIEATALAAGELSTQQRSTILRAGYALARRVEIWKQVRLIVQGQRVPVSLGSGDDYQIQQRLTAIQDELNAAHRGEAWTAYLLLQQLQSLIGSGKTQEQHQLARQILLRMESDVLTSRQLEMLQQSPFTDLAFALRRWADEPIDCMALLGDIESYEESRRANGAHSLARLYQNARWSTNPEVEKMSDLLNAHYRNANIRIAVAGDLLNRLIPVIEPTEEDVNETIMGTQVYGVSQVHTDLSAMLIPDRSQWRIGLEASGEVTSSTAANAGPATFYNDALSNYLARKLLTIDRRGVSVWQAEAEAESAGELTGLRTDFDSVPLLGWLARTIAKDQHDSRFYSAQREAEVRLAARVSERLDDEVNTRLNDAKEKFTKNFLSPMKNLQLNPVALDLHTTKTRLIGRYRLASSQQLGAHTPRPQAPSDSLLSFQIHESAMNNVVEQLGLGGERSDLRDLYKHIGAMFGRPDTEAPDDIPDGVTIRFAASEPVRVRFEQGRVMLTLRIAELSRGRRRKWRNFAVRAYYAPDPTQLDANLVREGSIELNGRHITSLDRIALSGVFSKSLSRSRPFNLINKQIAGSKDLNDLQVTQFVVTEGWIGVALGPQYGASVERMATRPDDATPIR